jgi:hypothetical protein
MKDFLFLYRADSTNMPRRTPEEIQAENKQWMDWLGGIGAQNKLTSSGNRLDGSGKVVKGGNVITNGPYTEIKETIGGFSIVKSDTYEGAVEMAKGCPILKAGGNVEVREMLVM